MAPWKHPILGQIKIIPAMLCPQKVWRHFYAAAEHWERICGLDVGPMRTEVEGTLGVLRDNCDELPWIDIERWSRGRDLLVRHHETAYAPAYQTEMASSETVWTPNMDTRYRHKALTPGSVFVVVQLDEPSWVVTAFRPHQPTRYVEWDEADLRRHGEWYFLKETGMETVNFVRATAENLQRASTVAPSSVRDLWWLASAVGYGRLLINHAEVRATLPAAERALDEAKVDLLVELRRSLDWEMCLGRLAGALKENRPEDLESFLASVEELLAVASAIGDAPKAAAFCVDVEALIVWLPAGWSHLARHAAVRCEAFGTSEHAVYRLWAAVEGAAVGAAIRETEPAVRPTSRLVDALIPAEPKWKRLLESTATLAQNVPIAVSEWVQTSLAGINYTPPVPVMGGVTGVTESWRLFGRPAPGAPHFRMFIVDEDHLDGLEVSGNFTEFDGELWRTNQGDKGAMVVLFASRSEILGGNLEATLAHAAGRDDVFVDTRVINLPT